MVLVVVVQFFNYAVWEYAGHLRQAFTKPEVRSSLGDTRYSSVTTSIQESCSPRYLRGLIYLRASHLSQLTFPILLISFRIISFSLLSVSAVTFGQAVNFKHFHDLRQYSEFIYNCGLTSNFAVNQYIRCCWSESFKK